MVQPTIYYAEVATVAKTHENTPFLIEPAVCGCSLFVSPESSPAPILNVVGEIDLGNAPKIYSALWQSSQRGSLSLIINLEQLDFMDSSGLQILLRLREKLKARKQDVFLVAPKPQISKLLRLTGFDKLFAMFDTKTEALTVFGATDAADKAG